MSLLSPTWDIKSLDDFVLGQQGIIMSKGLNRAVFLPEVAMDEGGYRHAPEPEGMGAA